MKRYLFLVFALLLILSTALWMVSCKDEPEVPMVDIVKDGVSQWRLVRSDTAASNSNEVAAAKALRSAILEATGCRLEFVTDYEGDDNGQMYEILIGDTVRAEDDEIGELIGDEFVIAFVGNKLLIKGGSDAALNRAITYFIDTYVGDGSAQTNLRIPEGLSMLDSYWTLMTEEELNIFQLSEEDYDLLDDLAYSSTVSPSDVEDGYEFHEDGGFIYNPISREKADQLNKHDDSEMLSGTLETKVNGVTYTLTYEIPKEFTAYDAVPIRYTLTSSDKTTSKVYISATSFDDPAKENEELYYDLNIPGTFDLDWEYLGYVALTADLSEEAKVTANTEGDVVADQYPHYDESELIYSGSVQQCERLYFSFRFTNTGNTILDGNGNGGFAIYPALYRKNSDGQWEFYMENRNTHVRIYDEVYPGDSGEVYFTFFDVEPGEYKLVINGRYRFEHSNADGYGKEAYVWDDATTSEYLFEIVGEDTWSEPQAVTKNNRGRMTRNGWLHTYEEFMSSYNTHLKGIGDGETIEETMYLQAPPWCEQVVLRLIVGEGDNMAAVAIPVEIETDSIVVNLNPDNNNYVVLDDGTRFPAIMTQTMADMRVNTSMSPNADQDIINDLLAMQEAGINVLQTTSSKPIKFTDGVTGTNDGIDAYWFMLDVARILEMRVQGWIGYPYHDNNVVSIVNGFLGTNFNATENEELAEAHGAAAVWQYERWGDNYWIAGESTLTLSIEDTRGWVRRNMNDRYVMTETSKQNFRCFLADLYDCDIDALNREWGTDYTCFDEIDPEEGTTHDVDDKNWLNYQSDSIVFAEWSRPLELLDQFRTLERISEYERILDSVREVMPTVTISLRTEGNNWLATVDPDSGNAHYRQVFYGQRRNGLVPELLANAGIITMHSDYNTIPYTPSEVAELTRSSVENGITPCILVMADWMRDIAINDTYGYDNSYSYNLDEQVTAANIRTTVSVFEWFKATYENGGVPGIMWQDYPGMGVANSTQIKEIKFFVEKLTEALNTPEGREWATNFTQDTSVLDGSEGLYTYDKEFLQDAIDEAKESRK